MARRESGPYLLTITHSPTPPFFPIRSLFLIPPPFMPLISVLAFVYPFAPLHVHSKIIRIKTRTISPHENKTQTTPPSDHNSQFKLLKTPAADVDDKLTNNSTIRHLTWPRRKRHFSAPPSVIYANHAIAFIYLRD